jgi:hypothetical protein
MIKALTGQIRHADQNLKSYGWDQSNTVDYYFDSNGFRVSRNPSSASIADLLIFGGSINFGVGVNIEDTFYSIISKKLNKTFYNMCYAQYEYNNKIIYETICQANKEFGPKQSIIQWVSDKRSPSNSTSLYDYIMKTKEMFPKSVHFLIDGRDTKQELDQTIFNLINPPWLDRVANDTHPGPKTHRALAQVVEKYLT